MISHDEIRDACAPFNPDGRYAEWTRVVYRLSDGQPSVAIWGDLPSYVHLRNVWGSATAEAERLVTEYRRESARLGF